MAPVRVSLGLADAASLVVDGERAVPTGDVWLASPEGDRIVTLDRPIEWLGAPATELERGSALTLVPPSDGAAFLGPRAGAGSAPAGSWLTDADSDVETSLARHAARACALTALAAALTAMAMAAYALVWL